jgi:hypothetical protein
MPAFVLRLMIIGATALGIWAGAALHAAHLIAS